MLLLLVLLLLLLLLLLFAKHRCGLALKGFGVSSLLHLRRVFLFNIIINILNQSAFKTNNSIVVSVMINEFKTNLRSPFTLMSQKERESLFLQLSAFSLLKQIVITKRQRENCVLCYQFHHTPFILICFALYCFLYSSIHTAAFTLRARVYMCVNSRLSTPRCFCCASFAALFLIVVVISSARANLSSSASRGSAALLWGGTRTQAYVLSIAFVTPLDGGRCCRCQRQLWRRCFSFVEGN